MTTTLTVHGMGCDGCEDIVESALDDADGVEEASADFEDDVATVEGEPDADELLRAVEFAGYDAERADA